MSLLTPTSLSQKCHYGLWFIILMITVCSIFPILSVFLHFSLCLVWPELSWFAGWIFLSSEWGLLFCPFFSTTLAPWHFWGKEGGNERLYLEEFHPGGKYQWFKTNILSEIPHYPAELIYSRDKMAFLNRFFIPHQLNGIAKYTI